MLCLKRSHCTFPSGLFCFFSRNSYLYNQSSQTKLRPTAPKKATSRNKKCFMMFCAKVKHFTWVFPCFCFFSWQIVVVSEDKRFAMSVETLRTLQQRLAERQPKLNPHLGIFDQETKSLQKGHQVVVEQIFPCLPMKNSGETIPFDS